MIHCLDCDAHILDAIEDSPNQFCADCLGLEHVGDVAFALDPEAEAHDYIGELIVARVEKKKPFVVQLSAEWRDDDGMGDDDTLALEPVYLTRTAAKKLMALLKKALAEEAEPRATRA